VMSVVVPVAGIVAAAVLDNRLSWGTVASVLVALYCHRLYRTVYPAIAPEVPSPPGDEELRPGWAARWGRVGSRGERCDLR
jgi:hypothetical protein